MLFRFLLMLFLIILLLIILIIFLLLFIPFKISVIYENSTIKIYLYKYLIYKKTFNLNENNNTFDLNSFFNKKDKTIDNDNNYYKILKRIKINEIVIKAGYQIEDWYLNSYLFILFYSLFGILDSYLYSKNINFNYEILNKKMGLDYIKVKITIKIHLIIKEIIIIGIKTVKKEKINLGMKYSKE